MKNSAKIGIVVLAAGASRRLGEPKQSLRFRGETLLRRAAKAALDAEVSSAVVVLGAGAEIFKDDLLDLAVEIVENKDWKTGMSGSIKIGLSRLLEIEKRTRAVLLTVCDQPFADAELFNKLIGKYEETGAPIVACEYAETRGVPAIFDKSLFSQLRSLDAKGGAKKIIGQFYSEIVSIPFRAGAFDIDTPADFLKLQTFARRKN